METLNQQQQGRKITLDDTEEIKCVCGSLIFKPAYNIRKVGHLLTETGRDEYVPIQIMLCNQCNKVYEPSKIIS